MTHWDVFFAALFAILFGVPLALLIGLVGVVCFFEVLTAIDDRRNR
jgi:hypothetical protein